MPAWVKPGGDGEPTFTGGAGSSRKFYSTGSSSASDVASVYHPTASGGGSGEAGNEPVTTPGVISINPLDPVGSVNAANDPITGLLSGLKDSLFGTSLPSPTGQHGGLLGDVPGVGAVARAGSEAVSNAGGAFFGAGSGLVGHAQDAVGGALERIPAGGATEQALKEQYQKPELQAWLDEKNQADPTKTNREVYSGDKGLFDTGLFANEAHMQSAAIRDFAKAQQVKNPNGFNPGAWTTPGSLADAMTLVLDDGFGTLAGGAQRALGGMKNAQGNDRLDVAIAIAHGGVDKGLLGTGFLAAGGITPTEQLAVQKFEGGEWTRDQALDFLASSGSSMSRDPLVQAAGSVIIDPLNVATFGAAGVAKAGLKGAETLATVEKAGQIMKQAEEALAVAQEAANGAKSARAIKSTGKALEAAQAAFDEAKAAKESLDVYHAANLPRGANVLGRAVEGSGNVQKMLVSVGKGYGALEGTMLGRAAKVTRTIIDPLHAIDLHMPSNARNVDLMSDALTKSLSNTLGDNHYVANIHHMSGLDKTGQVIDAYMRDLATAMANRGREGLLQMHQAAAVMQGAGGKLAGAEGAGLRDAAIEAAATSVKEKDLLKWLRYDATANILERNWSEAAHADLAQALEANYHVPAADWMEAFKSMSAEQKSLLKLANYGHSNTRLLTAISNSVGHASEGMFDLNRLVLLSKNTLTRVGGDSLLSQLKAVKGKRQMNQALAIITDWQTRYPELRYISIDPANPAKSIKQFTAYVEDHLDAMPMQVKAEELAKMHPDMQELAGTLGDGYQMGFRPKDEYLWGIERANEAGGEYIAKRTPWADHVGEGGLGYRPGHHVPVNIAGMPIIGAPINKAARALDYMEAGVRMLGSQVSGAQVHEVARQRFTSEALRGQFAEHGLTEALANKWWTALQEYTREHQGYSGPRGFGKGELWNALSRENLIPQTMLNGSMRLTESDVLGMVLKAYDGDMRYIGLTQKLSSRAKVVLSAATGFNSNFAGQIAEHAWPTLKFRYNPIFQLQEKVEPWVLNAQRGVSFATGTKLTEADAATERLLQRMTDNSLIRQADLDQAEYSAAVLLGKRLGATSRVPSTRLQQMTSKANAIMDVQGVKRLNMLRTFRKGLGNELRGAWDEAMPGVWDDMKVEASAKAGRVLDDDEFALQMMGENLFANDVRVMGAGRAVKADWANAIKPGAWHVPTHIGELKPLDLDHVAASMNTIGVDGKRIENLKDLRAYVAADKQRVGEVSDYLRRMGADPDYISRVENALTFSWTGFWQEAGKRFNLTNEESKALQDMVGGSAELRGMSPADYLSQVFHPGILDGTEGIVGSLDKPLGVLRRNKAGDVVGRGRSRLAGKEGTSTREDLVRQLSATFSQHLDPSAKRALLMEFKPELRKAVLNGDIRLDLKDLQTMWDADAEGQLADRILGYMDGTPGTGQYDVLDEEARGVKAVRDGADRFLQKNGVTPDPERRNYVPDEAHYQKVADEYGAMPTVDYEKTGRRPMTKSVYKVDSDIKPQPAGVDDITYETYKQFVLETDAQWAHMTAPKAKGGMGIEVTVAKGDPYTPDAAGRAAMLKDIRNGKLRVKGTDSDHPLMTNEQNVRFRAVHDVFGHAANDFEFGPRGELNAAATHFRMYSADARGALLTETHGQTAYVNYSKDPFNPFVGPDRYEPPPLIDENDPIGSFEQFHQYEVPEAQQAERMNADTLLADPDYPSELKQQYRENVPPDPNTGYVQVGNREQTQRGVMYYNKVVGDGIAALPKSQQYAILQQLSDTLTEFPDMRIHHVDVVNFSGDALVLDPADPHKVISYGLGDDVKGVVFGGDDNEAVMLLNEKNFGMDFEDAQADIYTKNEEFRQANFRFVRGKDASGQTTWTREPRLSYKGVPHNVDQDVEGLIRHEAGHALDLMLRPRIIGDTHERIAMHGAYYDAVERLQNNTAARKWLSEYGMTDSKEFAAELFSVATDPNLDLEALPKKLRPMVEEYQQALKDGGYWQPMYVPDAASLSQHGTVAEANAAQRGTVYAPQKAGLLPQATIDEFAKTFVGIGKHVESNPDVARTAQMFGKWSEAAVNNGLLRGDRAAYADILQNVAQIPTHSATPYNLTEGLAAQLATQTMVNKWEDAFRLQYFSQERSMLERSINHPMFGLYPASYMWGKLMPEVVQFLAQRPFGIRTGGALYSMLDVQKSIALQREYNPEFDAQIEKLGHSQALSFLGYLLPTLPWDISASAPTWMKDVASQGLRNEKNVAAGKETEGLNVTQPLSDVVAKLNPMETNIPWAGRAIDELNGANTPTEKRQELVNKTGAVKAANVGPELQAVYDELRAALQK